MTMTTTATCAEHLSCRLCGLVLTTATTQLRDATVAGARTVLAVDVETSAGSEQLGAIRDASYQCFAGSTRERWSAFGGGAHLGDYATQDEAVVAVCENAGTASFHLRMALHG